MTWSVTNVGRMAALTVLASILSGCIGENENVGVAPDYVYRSGMFVHPGPGDNHLDWIDENTLVFTASIVNPGSLLPKKHRHAFRWQLGNEPTQLFIEEIDFTCFDGTNQLTRTKEGTYYGGSYEEKKEIPATTIEAKAKDRNRVFVPYDCDYKQVWTRDRRTTVLNLKNDYGYIVSERERRSIKQTLRSPEGKVLSTFEDVPISAATLDYSRHADLHTLFQPVDSKAALWQWEESKCLKIWSLTRSGELSHECLPPGPWMHEGPLRVFLSNNGLLVISYVGADSGLYWIHDHQYYQLIAGSIRDLEVSPDGCKVAFVQHFDRSYQGGKKLGELMYLDICQFRMN